MKVQIIKNIIIIISLFIASYTDIKERKIKNTLVVKTTFIGITINLISSSYRNIIFSFAIFIMLILMRVLEEMFHGGGIGGGDIKIISLLPLYLADNVMKNFIFLFMIFMIILTIYQFKIKRSVILAPAITIITGLSILLEFF